MKSRASCRESSAARVVGFAHLIWIGEFAHLEEVDVDPDFGRRGIGRLLIEAACNWANSKDSARITLTTFRDVAWNAPFYARLGFRRLLDQDLSAALRELRHKEARDGFDPGKRIVMYRPLSKEVRG